MNYKFSIRSLDNLTTCDLDIQLVMHQAIKYYDFSVTDGYRGEKAQNAAYDSGNSKLRFPFSYHNKFPSYAVDVAPYPIDYDALYRFHELAGVIKREAKKLKIKLYWGFDMWGWDYPHWQTIKG